MDEIRLCVFWIGILLLGVGGMAQSGGNADCPCIDASDRVRALASGSNGTSLKVLNNDPDSDSNATCAMVAWSMGFGAQRYCYPVDYGSLQCRKWDENLEPHCVDANGETKADAPSWCFSAWCYVDYDMCRHSELQISKSILLDSVYISYSTCNHTTQSWKQFRAGLLVEQASSVKTLLAGVPTFYYPMLYKTNSTSGDALQSRAGAAYSYYVDDDLPWDGAAIRYANTVMQQSEGIASWSYTWVSASSQAAYSSDYTACVMDIYKGLIDFCVGDFWVTQERLELAAFTTSTHMEDLHLFVPRPKVNSDISLVMWKVFAPFSSALWCVIFLLALIVGALDAWLTAKKEMQEMFGPSTTIRIKTAVQLLLRGMYSSLFDFIGGGADSETCTWPSRILKVGWGFFVLIALSAYTANLAAFLTKQDIGTYWRSVEDVMVSRETICAPMELKALFKTKYPSATFHFTGFLDVVLAYDRGECVAYILSLITVQTTPWVHNRVCEQSLVSVSVVTSVPTAYPSSSDVVALMSMRIVKAASQGIYFMQYLEQPEYQVAASCNPVMDENSDSKDDLIPLDIQNFAGTLVIMMIAAVSGIVLKIYEDNRRRAYTASVKWHSESSGAVQKSSVSVANDFPAKTDDGASNPDEATLEALQIDGLIEQSPYDRKGAFIKQDECADLKKLIQSEMHAMAAKFSTEIQSLRDHQRDTADLSRSEGIPRNSSRANAKGSTMARDYHLSKNRNPRRLHSVARPVTNSKGFAVDGETLDIARGHTAVSSASVGTNGHQVLQRASSASTEYYGSQLSSDTWSMLNGSQCLPFYTSQPSAASSARDSSVRVNGKQ